MITRTGTLLSGKLLSVDMLDFNILTTSFERSSSSVITEMGNYENEITGEEKVIEISAGILRQMLKKDPKIPVIDLRDPEDYTEIGFKTIPVLHYEISNSLNFLEGTEKVVFYCRSGSRSASVINYLRKVHNISIQMYSLVI